MDTEEMGEWALNIGESSRSAEDIVAFVWKTIEDAVVSDLTV